MVRTAQEAFDEAARHWEQSEDFKPKPNGHAAAEPSWPEVDPAAYHGRLGEIVDRIRPNTEADPVAVLGHLLAFFGNAAGRSAHYEVEGVWHCSNLFLALVGQTSQGRKGTAAARARQAVSLADDMWSETRFADGMSSGEGLIWAVRDPIEQEVLDKKTKQTERMVVDHGEPDKRLCVLESEFGRVLQVFMRQGNTLSPVIRQAWETGRLMSLTKNSPARATDALITIIAHISRDELLRHLDSTEIASGLVNRFIFLAVKRSKILPFGGSEIDFGPLAKELKSSLHFARQRGRLTMDDDARELWADAYEDLTEDVPGLYGAITARGAPQVIRLALIYALVERSYYIGAAHLSAALALWKYSRASVRQIFGDALGDPVADTILAALRARRPDGMTRTDINNLFSRNATAAQIGAALDKLLTSGKAARHTIASGPGRPTEMWGAT